MYNSAIKGRYK